MRFLFFLTIICNCWVSTFFTYTGQSAVTKDLTIAYKKSLESRKLAVRSINSMLAALNSFLDFIGWIDCKVKNIRCQRQTYCAEEKELSKAEYMRLLVAAKDHPQLNLVMQTICGTGIRVSELKFFTVESVRQGEIAVRCKSKTRTILIPGKLKKMLLEFAKKNKIAEGAIFITRNGNPLDRSNIWAQMKKLCESAGVNSSKVFPHNLRKLFARTFYGIEKDIAKLANVSPPSSPAQICRKLRLYMETIDREKRAEVMVEEYLEQYEENL